MTVETPALIASILAGPHASDCRIDPGGSPPGPSIRVLFDAPFLGQDQQTGTFANTAPQALASAPDVADVIPQSTVLRIAGINYTVNRAEAVEGGSWIRLLLNTAP